MNFIATLIYSLILKTNNKLLLSMLLKIRALMLKFCDPLISLQYQGIKLTQPFSHQIFYYQKIYPTYDRNLEKIANCIKQKSGFFHMIDVGANIGDTACFCKIQDAIYLLIEGESKYSELIKKNLAYNLPKISMGGGAFIETSFISDDNKNYSIELQDGSGRLKEDSNQALSLKTLDSILEKYSQISFNFIKIDTDGFDFKVIRSGKTFLQTQKPIIYFEWDKNHLNAQNEDPLSIFNLLLAWGYEEILIFDNFGNPMVKSKTNDYTNLSLLIEYTQGNPKNIYYYDVLCFHRDSEVCIDDYFK